ncbi:MAG: M20 metallopeptidase family protein [Christensenellales bacterium]
MKLHPKVADLLGDVTRLRRDLHQIPELGYHERKTQAYILKKLTALSPDRLETIADTGVKAVFQASGKPKTTTAFRADIDALAIHEHTGVSFASCHEGFMHACGHDGHAAALLAFAKLVADHRHRLAHNVVLLFQPAEEHIGGAARMVKEGALDNPKVDRIFGMHIWPDVPSGMIGLREGPMMAQTCEFDIIVHGKSAHGASPHKGVDAIVASAEIISALQTIVTRSVGPQEKALLTIGKIEGGQARNIIADRVVMNGTVRTFKDSVHEHIKSRIKSILKGMEQVSEVYCEFTEVMHYPVLNNPRPLVDLLLSLAEGDGIMVMDEIMAAEDFSFYQHYVPGLFFLLGVGGETFREPLHSPRFNFDEADLLGGIEVYRRIIELE